MKKVKCGVIGCGWIGQLKHIAYIVKAEDAELTAICDVDGAVLEKVVKDFNLTGVKVYKDYRELCADPNVEAVHVCTPNSYHHDMTMCAIANGRHVFCEKPLATTTADAVEMVEAAKKAGVKLALGHQRRFGTAVQYIRQMVDRGELGEVYYGKALDARRRGVPTWGVYMSKAENGGGILYDGAPHSLDLTMYMMNNFRPVAVQGKAMSKMRYEVDGNPWGKWDPEKCDVEDTGFALITMENGATIYLEAAWAINMLGIANSSLICGTKGGADLQGPNGTARINTFVNDKMVTFSPEYPPMPNTEPYIGEAEASDAQMKDWVDAILEDRAPFVQGVDGIPVVQIIEAIFESSKTGETVKITEHYR